MAPHIYHDTEGGCSDDQYLDDHAEECSDDTEHWFGNSGDNQDEYEQEHYNGAEEERTDEESEGENDGDEDDEEEDGAEDTEEQGDDVDDREEGDGVDDGVESREQDNSDEESDEETEDKDDGEANEEEDDNQCESREQDNSDEESNEGTEDKDDGEANEEEDDNQCESREQDNSDEESDEGTENKDDGEANEQCLSQEGKEGNEDDDNQCESREQDNRDEEHNEETEDKDDGGANEQCLSQEGKQGNGEDNNHGESREQDNRDEENEETEDKDDGEANEQRLSQEGKQGNEEDNNHGESREQDNRDEETEDKDDEEANDDSKHSNVGDNHDDKDEVAEQGGKDDSVKENDTGKKPTSAGGFFQRFGSIGPLVGKMDFKLNLKFNSKKTQNVHSTMYAVNQQVAGDGETGQVKRLSKQNSEKRDRTPQSKPRSQLKIFEKSNQLEGSDQIDAPPYKPKAKVAERVSSTGLSNGQVDHEGDSKSTKPVRKKSASTEQTTSQHQPTQSSEGEDEKLDSTESALSVKNEATNARKTAYEHIKTGFSNGIGALTSRLNEISNKEQSVQNPVKKSTKEDQSSKLVEEKPNSGKNGKLPATANGKQPSKASQSTKPTGKKLPADVNNNKMETKKSSAKSIAGATKLRPTVLPVKHFNASNDATVLHGAMKSSVIDGQTIVDILCRRSNEQRQAISEAFARQFEQDLIQELKSVLGGKFGELTSGLVQPPNEFLCQQLFKGNDKTFIDILCSQNNKQLGTIRRVFKKMFSIPLEEHVRSKTSGVLRQLLELVLAGTREPRGSVDPDLAVEQAKELYEAGENRWGTDESVFNKILTQASSDQLQRIFKEYRKLTERTIEQAVKAETSGSLCMAYKAIINCAKNSSQYCAKRLHEATDGLMGADDTTLILIVVSRSEIDLQSIVEQFEQIYDRTLVSAFKSKTSGNYQTALRALIGSTNQTAKWY